MTTANLSALLKTGTGSSTSLLAAYNGGTSTLTYTPTTPVQVHFFAIPTASNTVTINGVTYNLNSGTIFTLDLFIGQGQTLTVTNGNAFLFISALKVA